MPKCKQIDGVVIRLVAVQRNVACIPERNDELAQLRRFLDRSPNRGMRLQKCDLPRDGLRGAPARLGTPSLQILSTPLQAMGCCFRNDYSWHFGGSASASVPHVSNHAFNSSLER